jgi:hypothetical protein
MIEGSEVTLEMLKCLVFFSPFFASLPSDSTEVSLQGEKALGGQGDLPWVVVSAKGVASRQPA